MWRGEIVGKELGCSWKYSESSPAKSVCCEGSYRSGEDERLHSAVPHNSEDIVLCLYNLSQWAQQRRDDEFSPQQQAEKIWENVGDAFRITNR